MNGIEIALIWPVIIHALIYGAILSGVLFTLMLGIACLNPEIFLKDYPPDIQAKYGPMSDRSKRQKIPVAILFFVVLFVIIIQSFKGVHTNSGDLPFLVAFLHLFVMFSFFNLLDWLVFDWVIIVTIRPRFIILPGTEGLPGYADYWFHFRGFLIGSVITFFTSLLLAVVVTTLV